MVPMDFEDWQAIQNLKACYCRYLDSKRWDDYAALFTEDFIMDCSDDVPADLGNPVVHGRNAAVAQVRGFVDSAVTIHQVHSPEISATGADTATAIWAMSDIVFWPDGQSPIAGIQRVDGFGHYYETYRRGADGWLIASMKLTRLDLRHS